MNSLEASREATELDRDIRNSIISRRLSIITMGLNLSGIKSRSLYTSLGCQSMPQYIRRLCNETKMERSSIYKWLYIGEAYIDYRDDLERIGFGDSDGPSKLVHLERALENNEKAEVFDNIKNMSLRGFISYSKNLPPKDGSGEPPVTIQDTKANISGRFTVKINTRLNKETFAYLRRIISIADRALEEGELIIPVRLRNIEEARRFKRASVRIIDKIRKMA